MGTAVARPEHPPASPTGSGPLAHELAQVIRQAGSSRGGDRPPPPGAGRLERPWYGSADPLAPYTVLKASNPRAYAALDATAKQRTLRLASQTEEPAEGTAWRTRTEVPVASLLKPPVPPYGALAPLRDRLWPLANVEEPDKPAMAAVLHDEVVGRWASGNADLLAGEVGIRLKPPSEIPISRFVRDPTTGLFSQPTEEVLEFTVEGQVISSSDGSIDLLTLDLLGSNDLETVIAEVEAAAAPIGQAADYVRTTAALLESEGRYWGDVDADPDAFARSDVLAHLGLLQLTIRMDTSSLPEGGHPGPWAWRLDGFLSEHPEHRDDLSASLEGLAALTDKAVPAYEAFMGRHRAESAPEIELAEMKPDIAEAKERAGREWDEGSYFVAVCDYLGWGLGRGIWGTANLVTGDYYEARYEGMQAYRRGDISKHQLDELDRAAAGRAVVSTAVFLALTLATAGLAEPVLGLAPGLLRVAAFSGTANAVTTGVTMTTTSVYTRQQDFADPTLQGIWRQSAYGPGEIALGAAVSGAVGAAIPVAGVALAKMVGWLGRVAAPAPSGPGPSGLVWRQTRVLPALSPPAGWTAEEVGPGLFRLTHPKVPGHLMVRGQRLYYQYPSGTGMLEVEVPLGAAGRAAKALPSGLPSAADVDEALARGFEGEGPLVSAPVDSPLIDVGTGPSPADLGVGDSSVVRIVRTDVVDTFPIDRVLDAEGVLPADLVGSAQAVFVNNPYRYVPDLEELGRAVRPGGKIVIQGHREANKFFRALLKKGPPKGFVVSAEEGFDPVIDLSAATRADPDVMAEAIRRNILGGPFRYTKGGAGGPQPNVRVVYEKPIEGPLALGKRLAAASKGTPSRFNHVARELNALQLGQRNAAAAAAAATEEMGLHLVRVTRGEDVILSSVKPGRGQILVVKPDGTVLRGWADIAKRTPPDPEDPFDLSNIVEDPPILPDR